MNINILLSHWINALLTEKNCPYHLFDKTNFLEDGMDCTTYWIYEKKQFLELASIYELNSNFHIEVLSTFLLKDNKLAVVFYLYNQFNRIVYKMTQTLILKENKYLLSGNNYKCQLVPKFIVKNNQISGIGLAIESKYNVAKIISSQFELYALENGSNYEEDHFYSASFLAEDIIENKWYDFYLTLTSNNEAFTEKRKIYFDNFKSDLIPYTIKNESLIILDHSYPVNISLNRKDNIVENYSYPRTLVLSLDQYRYAIVTDCLDNDWHIDLNKIAKNE